MKVSRTQQAYHAIRQMIVDWELPPGTVLSEHQLAQRLKISRTPIREAMFILAHDGLVRNVPGESAVVAEFSMPEIIESYQMRLALESYAARLAAGNQRARELLVGVYEEMREARAMIDRGEVQAYHRLAERADSLIAAAAENRYIADGLRTLWGHVGRIRRIADIREARLHESVAEHLAILKAILAGQEERAEQASRAHLMASLNHVLRQLAGARDGDLGAVRGAPRPKPGRSRRSSATSGYSRSRAGSGARARRPDAAVTGSSR